MGEYERLKAQKDDIEAKEPVRKFVWLLHGLGIWGFRDDGSVWVDHQPHEADQPYATHDSPLARALHNVLEVFERAPLEKREPGTGESQAH